MQQWHLICGGSWSTNARPWSLPTHLIIYAFLQFRDAAELNMETLRKPPVKCHRVNLHGFCAPRSDSQQSTPTAAAFITSLSTGVTSESSLQLDLRFIQN